MITRLKQQAEETVKVFDQGYYRAPSGRQVDISATIADAKKGTVLYSRLPTAAPVGQPVHSTRLVVSNETTFSAVRRLAESGGHVGCLNFASARSPGGGFLTGAQAQEESLARASGLYPCLLMAPEYYEQNRANRSAIYLDLVIFSPRVPFIRDDAGVLLEKPVLASVITAPAPNAGAVAQNEPRNLTLVEPTLRRRAELVLAVAQAHGVEKLVLGAWGCGVFRNDPRMVAARFGELLQGSGRFASAFAEVVFAVFDRAQPPSTYRAFADRLSQASK